MNEKYKVYALVCPIIGKIRYIGVTRQQYLCQRLGNHMYVFNSPSNRRQQWIKELKSAGLRPSIVLLEETLDISREAYWVAKYRHEGVLLNDGDGGSQGPKGYKATAQHRERIGQASKGRISWMKGKTHTEEMKQRISKKLLGRTYTDEQKEHYREGASNMWKRKGGHSEESKQLMREKANARWERYKKEMR